jgi:CyaY protein
MRRSMTDLDFHTRADALLQAIEQQADRWLQADVIDVDAQRSGGLLELLFPDRSKLVVNKQPPLQEIWLASRRGGFHFQWRDGDWQDSKGAGTFGAVFAAEASHHGGRPLALSF